MSYLKSYKHFNKLIQNESFEPMFSWGLRMALSGTLPILWGLYTNHVKDAAWITLTAEAITWVEMKGAFAWRARTLLLASLLAIAFSVLGSITANYLWLSVLAMFATGFIATLLKSIGDRASGLGLCVYLMFIICNAFPVNGIAAYQYRFELIAIGAAWPLFVGIVLSLFMPAGEPFRRQIALIWRSISELADAISETAADRHDDIYHKEKEVRTAIDNSYEFYGRMAHQVNKKDNRHYQLALLRKVAGLVSVNILAIGEEINYITISELDVSLRIKAGTLLNMLREATSRISIFVITLKPEEKLLAVSHINRLKRLNELIRNYPLQQGTRQTNAIKRINQLTERTIKLLENAIQRIEQMGTDVPVYRSYSFFKTLFVLRPKYMLRNLLLLLNFNTLTARYALRSAIAAAIALFIYKWFNIDHGYWMPFTVMIVIQPYFGATLIKALDRIVGTILGGLAGGLLLYFPVGMHVKEGILFLTFIFMVYFIKKRYSIAVFTITLNLVLLFNIEEAYNNMLMISRAISTIGGALLAIISGFALLPDWDKKWLPKHLANALVNNQKYFMDTFYGTERIATWTRLKRLAETSSSDVFDSFNRYINEPSITKADLYYSIITGNVRITRNMNNIHLEQDEKKVVQVMPAPTLQQQKIDECRQLFDEVIGLLPRIYAQVKVPKVKSVTETTPFAFDHNQMTSLEKLIIELKNLKEDLRKLAEL